MKGLAVTFARHPPLVQHSRPCLGRDEEQAALRVLHSERLAPGGEAARLETLVARLAGTAASVAVSSGTTALALALRALGLGEDDDVAIPAYTCAAVAHAVRLAGARPLVCDVDPDTLAFDPADLRRRATPALRAVVAVHPFGAPMDVADLRLPETALIEDCAQSPGARLRGVAIGACGDASILSFGPTKLFTCGGPGGAVAASGAAVLTAVRDLAGHDEKDDDTPRLNGLLGDLHAAIAAAQIGRLADLVERRAAVTRQYDQALAMRPGARPLLPARADPVHYRYLLRAPGGAPALVARLQSRGILARHPVWRPLHHLVEGSGPCPGADAAHGRWVSLPLHPALGRQEVERVIAEVRQCLS